MSSASSARFLAILVIASAGFASVRATATRADTIPPFGSYQQTCSNLSTTNGVLTASCKDAQGAIQQNLFPWNQSGGLQCAIGSDIENNNGQLQCSRGGLPPEGSYTQTCRFIEVLVNGTQLLASCKDRHGNWGPFQVQVQDLAQCTPGVDISNNNGSIVCK
jgi:hypothetical protein